MVMRRCCHLPIIIVRPRNHNVPFFGELELHSIVVAEHVSTAFSFAHSILDDAEAVGVQVQSRVSIAEVELDCAVLPC